MVHHDRLVAAIMTLKPLPEGLRASAMVALDDCMQLRDRDALDQLWQLSAEELSTLESMSRRLIELIRVARDVRNVTNQSDVKPRVLMR